MSSVTARPRRLERHRAKIKGKKIAEAPGKGKAHVREATAVNIRTALALKKKSGRAMRELETLSPAELTAKLADERKELFNLRFKHATGQAHSVAELSATRRRIARILTLIRQKEVGA